MEASNRQRDETFREFRRIAEEIVDKQAARFAGAADAGIDGLLHELHVHQVELELQNEELRRAQQELEISRDRYADLYDFAPIGYATLDNQGRVQEINLTGSSLLGIERQFLLGKPLSMCIVVEHRERFVRHLAECLGEGREAACELTLIRRGRERLAVRLQSSQAMAASGPVCRTVIADVTAEKRAGEELRQAKHAAEEANRAKGQFLANMSHELRTPMAAILGMVEIALEDNLSPEVRDCLQTAKDSADHLLRLLNELLDLSRIEAGRFELERLPFRLRAIVEESVRLLQPQADKKALTLACMLDEGLPDQVVGDAMRLRQVLLNLLGNALKFTQAGSVRLRGEVLRRDEREVELRFAISDTGIGIAREDQQRIFAPFTQADASFSRRFGGSGMGLTITASLVELMGGHIWLESKAGVGSTFWFTIRLPLWSETAAAPGICRDGAAPTAANLRVLVVEDTPANQKVVVRMLQKRGHAVAVAVNGREAVDLIGQNDFDVVLMDVQMPLMDGLEATIAIRSLHSAKARVRIVAMTAHAMPGDSKRCLAAGMDAYLTKPIDQRALLDAVETHGRSTSPR